MGVRSDLRHGHRQARQGRQIEAPLVHRCIQQVIEGWEFPPLRTAAWYGTAYAFDPAY